MDSACSYHICQERDLFHSYSTSHGLVSLGNDHSCKVVGIGFVRIWMFDGVIRMLSDVRYIPTMK